MFGPLSAKMWGAALAKTRRRAGVKKAGERAGVVNAPARPLLPAVRAVSGPAGRGRKGQNFALPGS